MIWDKLMCWFFGHIPDEKVAGFVNIADDVDFNVTICERCEGTLIWDEQLGIWAKW